MPTPTTTSVSDLAPAPDLASVQPCELVDQQARSELGLSDGAEKKIGEVRVCRFRKEGATLASSFTVSTELFEHRGGADIVATDARRLPDIGKHRAVRYTGAAGGCAVSLLIGDKARVDATVVGGDQDHACDIAQQLAVVIEPGLTT